jgi:23S rRNA (pseudouridine1915-N3)-methyltransferase
VKLSLLAVGRLKDGPEKTLCDDYLRRLPWPFEMRELEVRKPMPAEKRQSEEGALLLGALPEGAQCVVLDEHGRTLTSPDLAALLGHWQDDGRRDVAFLIGGADGHADAVKARADLLLSFGRMTWPHMLARVMLTEQLYRAASILNNHPYHRA